jgi:hypothetical protein
MLAVAFLVFAPQIVIWKITTNKFWINPYSFVSEARFNFLSPQIGNVLFSWHRGLFVWSPILVFSVLGFWKMKGELKSYRWPIILSLLIHLYILSSWFYWWYGDAFGHRGFVDILGMLALPLACFFGSLQKAWIKGLVAFLSTFFIALTFYFFIQFSQGVLPGNVRPLMTWPVYKRILLDPSGVNELWQWLKKPQFLNYRLLK